MSFFNIQIFYLKFTFRVWDDDDDDDDDEDDDICVCGGITKTNGRWEKKNVYRRWLMRTIKTWRAL